MPVELNPELFESARSVRVLPLTSSQSLLPSRLRSFRCADAQMCKPDTVRSIPLHVAQCDRFPQGRQRIARRYEFVRHVAGKASVGDGLRDRAPVELL